MEKTHGTKSDQKVKTMGEIIASTYEIVKEIGSGAGGIVYEANHLRLKKKVILKADKREITISQEILRREVDVLKNLHHPNVPQVYDYFVDEGVVYTVIDYIEGESLDKLLEKEEKFSQAQVIAWAREILDALAYLHSPTHGSPPRGYVHSDIKPANIMKKPDGHVCLIDFNVALALGEENLVGRSWGYASPEHYSMDFSAGLGYSGSGTEILPGNRNHRTDFTVHNPSWTVGLKKVIPDARSDIYSLGATMYHLLSGKVPVVSKRAEELMSGRQYTTELFEEIAKAVESVEPLSKKKFSPLLVDIITKAMNPNPDLRYQSAEEMLEEMNSLHRNDIRSVRWRRRNVAFCIAFALLFVVGAVSAFIGLKRMQTTERWLRLTEDARNELQEGDAAAALQTVMQVYEEKDGILTPAASPKTQETLTDILGVYDTADEFALYRTVQLPSEPLLIQIAPDASTAVCMCYGTLVVVDLHTAEITDTLAAEKSAVAETEYLNSDTIVYAGADGLCAYSLTEKEELWKGEKATALSISGDGHTVAAVYKDNTYAVVYDAETGEEKQRVDFNRKGQGILSDIMKNLGNTVFCLNENGNLLAVSFGDGSLVIKDLEQGPSKDIQIFDETSGFLYYEGGFHEQYFAFAASTKEKEDSAFLIIDTEAVVQTLGFQSEGFYYTSSDENGIYIGLKNILVQIDPVTGEQKALIDTAERMSGYSHKGGFTVAAFSNQTAFYDENAREVSSFEWDVNCDVMAIQGGKAMIGSTDSPTVWILQYEDHADMRIAEYDPSYTHSEARMSQDGTNVMLFSYRQFRICGLDGTVLKEAEIPDAGEVFNQQYIRDGTGSWLQVIYSDGKTDIYDGISGEVVSTENGEPPDLSGDVVLETDHFRVDAPLHGNSVVYDRETGEQIAELENDGYLMNFIEEDRYLVVQYLTTDSRYFGYLMDRNCQNLAYLPNLCDVLPDALLFDDRAGHISRTPIYELDELIRIGETKNKEETNQ